MTSEATELKYPMVASLVFGEPWALKPEVYQTICELVRFRAQQMPNPIELYEAAHQAFRKVLEGVKENQMGDATPCSEWSVQNLIIHNIKVTGYAHGTLMENVTVDPQQVDDPLPSEGPVAALDAGVARVLELIKRPGSAEQQINSAFGQMTRGQFLMAPFMDLLVHSWDLAKGSGQNANLDTGLVEVCYQAFAPQVDGLRNMNLAGCGKRARRTDVVGGASSSPTISVIS